MSDKVKKLDKCMILLICLMVCYIIVFSHYTILRHNSFDSAAWDLGGFEQVFWKTIHNGTFFSGFEEPPIFPTGTFFEVHFSPILFPLLLVYFVFQTTETLLILQSIIISLGAIPLYWLVKEEMKSDVVALTFAGVYLLYPPLHGVNWFDFHLEAFLPVLFFLTFFYFKKEKWKSYFIYMILLLSAIESVAPTIIFMGVYGLIIHRKTILQSMRGRNWEFLHQGIIFYSIITIFTASLWLFIALRIIYFFNPTRLYLRWDQFGTDIPSMVINALSNPLKTLRIMFTPHDGKFFYLTTLLAPLFFLPLLDLTSFVMCFPLLVISLLSREVYWAPVGFQYPALIIGPLFVSGLYGYKAIFGNARPPNLQKRILLTMALVNVIFASILSPIGLTLIHAESFRGPMVPIGTSGRLDGSLYNEVLRRVIDLIPPNASVSTQNNIFPHLTRRAELYPFYRANMDYILIDRRCRWSSGWVPSQAKHNIPLYDDVLPELVGNGSYGLLAAIDSVYLFKNNYTGTPILIDSHGRGLYAKFYQSPDRLRLFSSNHWEVFDGASNVNNTFIDGTPILGELDSQGENIVQLRSSLSPGRYLVSCRARDTNEVTGDFRFGIWDFNDWKWLESMDVTLSESFNVYNLTFEVTEIDIGKELYFVGLKTSSEKNTIYVDWCRIEPLVPDAESVVLNIYGDWYFSSPFPSKINSRSYAISFEGILSIPQEGNYTFILNSDDCSRLLVDERIVVDTPWEIRMVNEFGTIYLSKGLHRIRVDYGNLLYTGGINLLWKTPWSEDAETIPYNYFYLPSMFNQTTGGGSN